MDSTQKRFILGMLLAWTPALPLLWALFNVFRPFSEQKATGLGAVAGGMAEYFMVLGAAAALVFPAVAIFLLLKSFGGGNWGRATLCVLTICWSVLWLSANGFFIWLVFVKLRQG